MKVNDLTFFGGKEVVLAEGNEFTRPLDGSKLYNIKPPFYIIDFTNGNSANVTWNAGHTQATFTHTMNCYPVVTVYTADGELVYPVVTVLNGNSFKLDFEKENLLGNETWHCVINYGSAYSDGNTEFSSQVTSIMNDLAEYMALATAVNQAIQEFNADNEDY